MQRVMLIIMMALLGVVQAQSVDYDDEMCFTQEEIAIACHEAKMAPKPSFIQRQLVAIFIPLYMALRTSKQQCVAFMKYLFGKTSSTDLP